MRCPCCDNLLRAMDSREVVEEGKHYRIIKLYCKKAGCPKNNGQPVMTDKVEEKHGAE